MFDTSRLLPARSSCHRYLTQGVVSWPVPYRCSSWSPSSSWRRWWRPAGPSGDCPPLPPSASVPPPSDDMAVAHRRTGRRHRGRPRHGTAGSAGSRAPAGRAPVRALRPRRRGHRRAAGDRAAWSGAQCRSRGPPGPGLPATPSGDGRRGGDGTACARHGGHDRRRVGRRPGPGGTHIRSSVQCGDELEHGALAGELLHGAAGARRAVRSAAGRVRPAPGGARTAPSTTACADRRRRP